MGDTVYGGGTTASEKCNADILQCNSLDARYIGFVHPITKEYMEFDAGVPEYFNKIIKLLKNV
jgi:23S rRNA pseudouridine1911/1915/1917 synthase